MQTWTFKSSSGPGEYTTRMHDDGLMSCECRGYLIKKEGKPRQCSHITDKVGKKLKLTFEQRGDLLYAVDKPADDLLGAIIPQVDHSAVYEDAHAAGYIEPMLASAMTKIPKGQPWETTIKPYQNGEFISQIKFDGQRVIVSKKDGKVRAWSRPKEGSVGLSRTLPIHIQDFCEKNLPDGTFDGEVIKGETGKSYDVGRLETRDEQSIVFFDIMRLGHNDLTKRPFVQRYEILRQAICYENQCVKLAGNFTPSAEQIKTLWDSGAEGVILKRIKPEDQTYYDPGYRSPNWLKIKIEFYTTGKITGYEKGKNGPYSKVVLFTDDNVETTVKTKNNDWLRKFEADPDKYVGQRLVFKHYGPTPDGKYRGPIIWDHFAGEGE